MMDMHDMDLSLFGGDLLVGFAPTTSAELKTAQDEQQSLLSPWATTDLDVSLGQDELSATNTSLSSHGVDQPLDASWMESQADLLELLANGGTALPSSDASAVPKPEQPDAAENAVKILQSIAEETTQLLAAGGETTSLPQQPENTVAAQGTTLVQLDDGIPSFGDNLLDMLSFKDLDSEMLAAPGAITLDLDDDITGDDPSLDMTSSTYDDAFILASVSAEDVESILSSTPPSPAATPPPPTISDAVDGVTTLTPEQSNSLLAQYLLCDLGTNSSPMSPSTVSELDSTVDSDDPDFVPPGSYRVSKTRTSPYSRGQSKPGPKSQKAVLDPEARSLDRKLRKKQQNKDAATRYRQKKREEAELVDQEAQELEDRNSQLKDKVEQMTREIGYLKNLLAEVYKARGLLKK